MGMAASQARYLALVARKTNCEYEGQQINQARTALSNQSANLFNQMLGLQVPVPPSTLDYTKVQYSYSDGINSSVIAEWQQLGPQSENYNYVVTHYYYTDRYTGSMKLLSDPQVQFDEDAVHTNFGEIKNNKEAIDLARSAYEGALADLRNIENYSNDQYTPSLPFDSDTDGNYGDYKSFTNLDDTDKDVLRRAYNTLVRNGALDSGVSLNDLYFDPINLNFILMSDITEYNENRITEIPLYNTDNIDSISQTLHEEINNKETALNEAIQAYNDLNHPTHVGNCRLTPLAELNNAQLAEIQQVIQDLEEQGITSNISSCFDVNGNYIGGIYQFKLNGITYYTTFEDLDASYSSGTGPNNIDGQIKLPYYNATYVQTKIEKTENALVETDGSGRFTSIRFEDDSVTYTLNMETVTDDVAYQDAMNEYTYLNAKYDKTIQDINAKTSIIQQEDVQLELRLKQLDTEQKALSTEIDAVSKVVGDNIEKSFKTFGG